MEHGDKMAEKEYLGRDYHGISKLALAIPEHFRWKEGISQVHDMIVMANIPAPLPLVVAANTGCGDSCVRRANPMAGRSWTGQGLRLSGWGLRGRSIGQQALWKGA